MSESTAKFRPSGAAYEVFQITRDMQVKFKGGVDELKLVFHSGDSQLPEESPKHYCWYSTTGERSVIIELRELLIQLRLIESSDLHVVEDVLEYFHEHGESPPDVRLEIYLNESDNALAHKKMETIKKILENDSENVKERLRPWRELMRSLGPLRPQGGGKRRRRTKRRRTKRRRTKRRKSNKTRKRKSR